MKRLFAFLAVLWALTALGAPADALTPGQRAVILGGGGPCYGTTLALNFSSQGGGGCYLGHNSSNFALVPGWSFTRASTGLSTRGDGTIASYGSGVPRITAPSSVANEFLQSNTFSNVGVWITATLTNTSGVGTAPDGTATASLLTPTAVSTTHNVTQTIANTGAVSISFWAKANGYNYISVLNMAQNLGATFNLSTATATTSGAATATITAGPGGWYYCTVSIATGFTASPYFFPGPNSTPFSPYTGDGVSGVYIWHAQLSPDPIAKTYVPTTSVAVTQDDWTAVRGNLWLNSSGTQTVTTTVGRSYEVAIFSGSGSITLTGGCTGTVALLSPVVCPATTTSVTGTVSGTVNQAQFEPVLYTPDVLTYPTAYIPTTSAPVYVYDQQLPGRGILIEQAATNLLVRSQDYSATWLQSAAVQTAASTLAPDGTLTGTKLTEGGTTSPHQVTQTQSVVNGTTYSYTQIAKAGTRTWLFLDIYDGATDRSAYFNLATGAVGTTAGGATASPCKTLANSWFACTVVATPASTSGTVVAGLATGDLGRNYASDGVSYLYIWQADLIANAFPLSPIPTTSAAVTRAADVAAVTGISGLGSKYTVIGKGVMTPNAANFARLADMGPAGTGLLAFSPSLLLNPYDGTNQLLTANAAAVGALVKAAISTNGVTGTASLLGGAPASGSFSLAASKLTVGNGGNNGFLTNWDSFVSAITVLPTVKPPAQLQTLSTLP